MNIIIAGAGEVGRHLAKMLSRENHDIVVLDTNEEVLNSLNSNYDLMTLRLSHIHLTSHFDKVQTFPYSFFGGYYVLG